MFVVKVLSDYGMFVFLDTLVQMAACVPNIIMYRSCNRSPLRTMLDRAKCLSSTQEFFLQECKNLKGMFLKLKYPQKLIDVAINRVHHPPDQLHTPSDSPKQIIIPYKRSEIRRCGSQTGSQPRKNNRSWIAADFSSKKIVDDLRVTELKPPLVSADCCLWI